MKTVIICTTIIGCLSGKYKHSTLQVSAEKWLFCTCSSLRKSTSIIDVWRSVKTTSRHKSNLQLPGDWQSAWKWPKLPMKLCCLSQIDACADRQPVRAHNLFIILSLSLWSHYKESSQVPFAEEVSIPKVKAPPNTLFKKKVYTWHHTVIQTLRGWLSL